MPSIEKHAEINMQRTSKPYREVHEWIDEPLHENERHDITRVLEFRWIKTFSPHIEFFLSRFRNGAF
jgi:hypothetical protein